MASMQDRLKVKRISSFEVWSTREQLCLASSVLKSGDQNWISVSRSLKPFIEKEVLRPSDWFSQKSCAVQYAYLLENADTPKRKKRESGETTSESIVRRLTQERIAELSQILIFQRNEYLRHKVDVNLLKSSMITDEKVEKMWLDMQQEEREQEQKTRAHATWLAKRQQKLEISSPLAPSTIGNQCKLTEGTVTEIQESSVESAEDDEKKNRGGRSPLLTSLLKSPSPTTQTQTTVSVPVQVNSPTITSLLGSSSKTTNTQLTQNVSPQLQQLVSTAIASAANTTSERPSVGAPTLSMLLEMPASSQRSLLPNLQVNSSATIITPQVTQESAVVTTEHNFPQTQQQQNIHHQMTIQNAEVTNVTRLSAPALTITTSATNSMPLSENMVIDNIDDVIRKDIITNVMDKDEINEIIGDIEELINEEITASSPVQTLHDKSSGTTMTSATGMIGVLAIQTSQQEAEIPMVTEPCPKPRDVDEAVSLSNSPQSEMAIEEIDSSTSNIAEIIGTVAIESHEPKIIVSEITVAEETILNTPEEIKSKISACDEKIILTEELVPNLKSNIINNDINSKDNSIVIEEKQSSAEVKSLDIASDIETEKNEQSKLPPNGKEMAGEVMEEGKVKEGDEKKEEEEIKVTVASNDKDIPECAKEQRESLEDVEGKNNVVLDQLEMHLAKITGDQQDVPSMKTISVSLETINKLPSIENIEKSQDISLILEEDDESNQNSESKKKVMVEQIIENTIENTVESPESFKEDSIILIKKEKTTVEIKEESSIKLKENEEMLEIYTEEFKKEEEEETKEASEDTTSSILQDIEIKEEEIDEPTGRIENTTTHIVSIEEVENVESESVEMVMTNTKDASTLNKKTENVKLKFEESKMEIEAKVTTDLSPKEDRKNENAGVKKKEEKEDVKKNIETEQNMKKEIESGIVSAGEEPNELEEEESSLSKLSGGRAMKTYSKRQQNVSMDSEPENEGTGEGADYRAWKKAVMLVYNRLATHKYASIFLRPITEDQAPGYHSVIFRPMDLSTIKKNIDNGTIRSTMHFQRDVMLMFQNAIMYNKHDTFIYKMAVSMQEECLQHMQILVQVTGEGTFRRETRTAASSNETNENSAKRKRSHITPSPHDTDSPRSKKRRKSEND